MIFPRAKVKRYLSQTNFKNWFGNVVELQCILVIYRGLKQVLIEEYFQHNKNLKDFSSSNRCGGITVWVLSCPTADPLWEKQREEAAKPFFIHSELNCSHSSTTKRLSQQLNAYRGGEWEITGIYFPYSSANTKRGREIGPSDWWGVCTFVNRGVVLLEQQIFFQGSFVSTKRSCTLSEVILCRCTQTHTESSEHLFGLSGSL